MIVVGELQLGWCLLIALCSACGIYMQDKVVALIYGIKNLGIPLVKLNFGVLIYISMIVQIKVVKSVKARKYLIGFCSLVHN